MNRLAEFLQNIRSKTSGDFEAKDRFPTILFFFTIIFYVFHLLMTNPYLMLEGEMWAEMATNYFINAQSPSYFVKLFSTDAGYIPILPRLIALVANLLNLKAATIPYFYNWTSATLTAIMVGTFCLSQFRALVKSDALRFLVSISILVICDFETRTFINFTYFAAFFVAIITALSLVENSKEVPWWSWFIPILILSKPAVLAALPMMLIVAIVSKPRFRLIAVISLVLCLVQILQIVVSNKNGQFVASNELEILSKILALFEYFFGLLGKYLFGRFLNLDKFGGFLYLDKYVAILVGIVTTTIIAFLIKKKKYDSTMSLVIVGMSLLFFNVALNSFALSDGWNLNMSKLDVNPPVHRHIIVGFFGCILIACAMSVSASNCKIFKSIKFFKENSAVKIFFIWLVATNWLLFGLRLSTQSSSPILENSQWKNMSEAIDLDSSPLCVPIDPLGWLYSKNCNFLNPMPKNFSDKGEMLKIVNLSTFKTKPSLNISDKTLVSTAILVRPLKPLANQKTLIDAQMVINLKNGNSKNYFGRKLLDSFGGLILLNGKEEILIKDISSIEMNFSQPVELVKETVNQSEVFGIIWMGY